MIEVEINEEHARTYGKIVSILIGENLITIEQADYAHRICAKLVKPKPLLEIVQELDYISSEQVKTVLQNMHTHLRIGEFLVEMGYISQRDLDDAFAIQQKSSPKPKIGEILIKRNFISEQAMYEALSIQFGFPYVDPQFVTIDKKLFLKCPVKWYHLHHFMPIRTEENGAVLVVFANPMDGNALKAAEEIFGTVSRALASLSSIEEGIVLARGNLLEKPDGIDSGTSAVDTVNEIITEALNDNVSDIHVEPMKDRLQVRFRQDGVLVHFRDYPADTIPSISSRIKIMCEADIAERRRHQGGRIFFNHGGIELDLRVSFYVTIYGEKIVLRLLNRQNNLLNINEIGMSPRMLRNFQETVLDRPSGVIMVTGPTGSGKTSTVYSCINYLKNPNTSIITAEDPVEYVIDGISQCSINPKINLTFEETLRHIVRQDPDIVVIGEIRDQFSAEIAVQAALTGHKVLTTFHTEDSIGGLIRLLNMNIEAFLISSTVVSVVAQRLLRRICPNCKTEHEPDLSEIRRLGYSPADMEGNTFYEGRGCMKCRYTGYKGRVAVFEILVLDEAIRDALLNRSTSHEIRSVGMESSGLITLLEDGISKAAQGHTTLKEVLRCLPRLQNPRSLAEIQRLTGIV